MSLFNLYKNLYSKLKIIIQIFFLLFAVTFNTFATENNENNNAFLQKTLTTEEAEGLTINLIKIEGNNRTSDDIILLNFDFKEGETFTSQKIKNSIQNLKNLQIFLSIQYKIYKSIDNPKKIDLVLEFDEKWTLLPYVLFGSGGGVSYYLLGFFDTNFIGRFYTLNFTYGCKNENCSTYLFFRNPNVFGYPFNIVTYLTFENNIFNKYNDQRIVTGTFTNHKNNINMFSDFKINSSFMLGLGFVYTSIYTDDKGISESENKTNKVNNFNLPKKIDAFALQTRLTIGKINHDNLKSDGLILTTIFDSTVGIAKELKNNYNAISNNLLYYNSNLKIGSFQLPLPSQSYLAIRANISINTSEIETMHYYIGGLDKIRGFYDGEFSGNFSWFSNIELRIPSYINQYIALQHALFSDTGYASTNLNELFSNKIGLSIGTGIRIIPLKVNRVALRFDLAYTLNPFNTYGFSFGLLQFF